MKEYVVGKATVRIHPGQRTEEERRAALEKSATKFLKEVHRRKKMKRAGESHG